MTKQSANLHRKIRAINVLGFVVGIALFISGGYVAINWADQQNTSEARLLCFLVAFAWGLTIPSTVDRVINNTTSRLVLKYKRNWNASIDERVTTFNMYVDSLAEDAINQGVEFNEEEKARLQDNAEKAKANFRKEIEEHKMDV